MSDIKPKHFPHYLDDVVRLNNGSFGCCPVSVLQIQESYRQQWLVRPDESFFSGDLGSNLILSLKQTCSIFKHDSEDWYKRFCFTENATIATAMVANHWSKMRDENSCLVITDCIYGGTRKIYEEYLDGISIIEIKLLIDEHEDPSIPQSKDEILRRFEREWKKHDLSDDANLFCHIDYISSQPSLLLPVKEMIQLIRAYTIKVSVLVDAAQLFLVDEFDLKKELGNPDFALINLHKWNFAPISACLLYSESDDLHHIVPSWNKGLGMCHEGMWTGTRDYSAYLTAKDAIHFLRTWRSENGETCREYCKNNLKCSVKYLSELWGTSEIFSQNEDILPPNMGMVMLPDNIPEITTSLGPRGDLGLRRILRERFNIECSLTKYHGIGSFVRLSFGLYNTFEDVKRLGNSVRELIM